MVKRDFVKHIVLLLLLLTGIIGLRVWFFEPVTITKDESNTYLHENDSIIAFQEYYTEDLTVATITDGKLQVIPRDYFLVLNDNRTNKNDSRTFGLIPKKNVIGRLTFRVSPLSDFGFIKTGLVNEN